MVLYASATSRTEACESGGRWAIRRATAVKVPQVHGKLSPSICELIEVASGRGLCGWEKLCMAWNLLGCEGTDIPAGCELMLHDVVIWHEEALDRVVILWGIGAAYWRDSEIETICKTLDDRGVFT